MKIDFENYTIVPFGIHKSKKIACKLISKRKNIRKEDKLESSEDIVFIDVDEKLNVPLLSTLIFQYKIARSGSTLLGNMLEHDSDWKIVSKPNMIEQLHEVETIDTLKYLKKIIEILSIQEFPNQKYCYFDFNSDTIFNVRSNLKKIFEDAIEYYLYRRPVEVFDSLKLKHSPRLLKYGSIYDYINKSIDSCKDIKIHYYRNVLSMQVVDWLYKKINKKLSISLYDKMKDMINFCSYDKNTKYQLPEELVAQTYDIDHQEFIYNEKFTNFFLSNPPYQQLNEGSREIEKFDWNIQREEILKLFDKKDKPFIVTNVITDKNLFKRAIVSNKLKGKDLSPGLVCTRENYFTWHKQNIVNKMLPDDYSVHSTWGQTTYDEWKFLKDMYLVMNSCITHEEHPSFEYFKKSEDGDVSPGMATHGVLRVSHLGAITSEHYDCNETILHVGGGQKRMYLLEESVSNKLGIYPLKHKCCRRIIPNLMYLDTFKNKMNMSKVWVGDINKNEMIYFPAKWTHLTISQREHTWSLNYRCKEKLPSKIKHIEDFDEVKRLEQEMHPFLRKGDFINKKI